MTPGKHDEILIENVTRFRFSYRYRYRAHYLEVWHKKDETGKRKYNLNLQSVAGLEIRGVKE